MTGPEHYRAAERFLEHSKNHTDQGNGADAHIAEVSAAQAQVHATLALAAATAEPIAQSWDGPDDTTIPAAWSEAIS